MAEEFSPQGVTFVFVYTREAHPSDRYLCHANMEQKLVDARDMVTRWQISRPMLVDDLEGTVHRAYGTLPNMSYIVNAGGTILYRASWTDPRSIRVALEQILYERGQAPRGD